MAEGAPPPPPAPQPYTPPPPPVAPQYLPSPYSPQVAPAPMPVAAPAPMPVAAPAPMPAPVPVAAPAPMPAPVPVAAPRAAGPVEVRRPKGSPFAARYGAPVPEGAKLYVESADAFFGLRFGACTATFEKGAHTVAEELEDGWFVAKNGVEFPIDEPLGVLEDNHGNKARLEIKGALRLKIDEPGDFAAALGASGAIDIEQMTSRVRAKVRDLIDGEVRDLLAKDRYFTSLRSRKATDEIAKEVRLKWAGDPDCDPFTSVEVLRLDLPSELVKDEPAPDFAPPPPNPSVAPGTPMAAAEAPSVAANAATVLQPAPVEPEPPAAPPGPVVPAEGARVDVDWGNGQAYPGAVLAAGVLVRFDNGQEHWISLDRVTISKG